VDLEPRLRHHRVVGAEAVDGLLARGEEGLASGDFDAARLAFEAALAEADTPRAHDGLGRALWWQGNVDDALDQRERAYAGFRASGERERAVLVAVWIAREYLEAVGNQPAANGWMARAERLLGEIDASSARGWLDLTRGAQSDDPAEMRSRAESAVDAARRFDDVELEASALALLGRALILAGRIDDGMSALDEAMTAATAGEVRDPIVFGDICCVVTRGCEEAGEVARLMRWNEVIESYLARHHHAPLLSFCGTCCAEMLQANGALVDAERWLTTAVRALEGTGHTARCVHPAAKLAELRVLQGRIEEAERLLIGYEDLPEAVLAVAAVNRAKGEPTVAKAVLLRRLNELGDTILSVAVLSALVEADLATGHVVAARSAAERLRRIANASGHPRVAAVADLAGGRVALAARDPDALALLEAALAGFTKLEMALDAARTRMEIARTLRDAEPEVALREARLAAEAFDAIGATAPLDEVSALARELGGPARTGPKAVGLLSRREREVLALLGEGLTNAEIAARLYISTKTAAHHVSSILSKLHLRSRAEAGAFALRGEAAGPPSDRK
jgi:DNA-binding CsgD family transcriptional regulator